LNNSRASAEYYYTTSIKINEDKILEEEFEKDIEEVKKKIDSMKKYLSDSAKGKLMLEQLVLQYSTSGKSVTANFINYVCLIPQSLPTINEKELSRVAPTKNCTTIHFDRRNITSIIENEKNPTYGVYIWTNLITKEVYVGSLLIYINDYVLILILLIKKRSIIVIEVLFGICGPPIGARTRRRLRGRA
jgi:hypothetical protein